MIDAVQACGDVFALVESDGGDAMVISGWDDWTVRHRGAAGDLVLAPLDGATVLDRGRRVQLTLSCDGRQRRRRWRPPAIVQHAPYLRAFPQTVSDRSFRWALPLVQFGEDETTWTDDRLVGVAWVHHEAGQRVDDVVTTSISGLVVPAGPVIDEFDGTVQMLSHGAYATSSLLVSSGEWTSGALSDTGGRLTLKGPRVQEAVGGLDGPCLSGIWTFQSVVDVDAPPLRQKALLADVLAVHRDADWTHVVLSTNRGDIVVVSQPGWRSVFEGEVRGVWVWSDAGSKEWGYTAKPEELDEDVANMCTILGP